MGINQWPKAERPREKLLNQGAAQLTDSELLAIFLRTGIKGKSAVELARDMLQQAGGLRQLLKLSFADIVKIKGLGQAKYAQLQATLEMSRRILAQNIERETLLSSPCHTKQYLKSVLRDEPNERFWCIFLDNHHRVISSEALFSGTINAASVYPRVVVQRALYHNAAAIIFAHNHPSGIADASQADIDITAQLKQSLNLIDVRVLDHFIVGEGEITSMAEQGKI